MKAPAAQMLAVDDEAVIALDFRRLLQPLGAELTIVSSGEQAMRIVRQRRFDLVMLNVHLPGISGLDVCRRLKQDPGLMDIPIIFLTGETNPQYVDIAYRLGAADYLTKPYEPEDFKTRVLIHLFRPGSGDNDADLRPPVQAINAPRFGFNQPQVRF